MKIDGRGESAEKGRQRWREEEIDAHSRGDPNEHHFIAREEG